MLALRALLLVYVLYRVYSTLRGQIKGAGRDCICARVHPLSKHELVSATIKTCTCIGVISGPLSGL